jgi:lipopolysaccharide export system permease protein
VTIIDRYVALTFVRSYVLLLAVGIGLYVVADLLVNLDEFTENRALSFWEVVGAMADYYGHNLPLYFTQLGGPAMAFAGAFTVAMLLRNNEMTALVAAGMPLQRLTVPIVVCSVLLVALWMINVLPTFAPKIARRHDDLIGVRQAGIDFARDDHDAILTARRMNLPQQRLEYVVIIEPAQKGGCVIEADAAVYDPQAKTWRLEAGKRIVKGNSDDVGGLRFGIERQPLNEYPFTLTPEELLLRQSAEWTGMLSLRQMNALLRSRNLPNLLAIRMQRHIWLTEPLLQWLLLLLSLPFFLRREPCSVLAAGGWALLLAGAFFAVVFCAHHMITAPSPALLAWIPILTFGPVAVLQLANVKT